MNKLLELRIAPTHVSSMRKRKQMNFLKFEGIFGVCLPTPLGVTVLDLPVDTGK